MKKAIIIMIIAVIIIIIILSSLVAYAKGDSNDNKMEDKVTQELMYLNQYFVTMLGDFNGLTIGDNRLQETEPKIQTNINTNLSDQADKNKTQGNDNLQQNSKVENKTDTVQNGILKNDGKYDAKWDKIETEVEQIYQVWNTVSIDLYSLSINNNAILTFTVIAIITFILSMIGVKIGSKFGSKYDKVAQIIGGIILILLGTNILLEHLKIL